MHGSAYKANLHAASWLHHAILLLSAFYLTFCATLHGVIRQFRRAYVHVAGKPIKSDIYSVKQRQRLLQGHGIVGTISLLDQHRKRLLPRNFLDTVLNSAF